MLELSTAHWCCGAVLDIGCFMLMLLGKSLEIHWITQLDGMTLVLDRQMHDIFSWMCTGIVMAIHQPHIRIRMWMPGQPGLGWKTAAKTTNACFTISELMFAEFF